MLYDRFHHVFGTSRVITASRRQKRRDEGLVPFQDTEEDRLHLANARFTSLQRSGNEASSAVRRGLKTKTQPCARAESSADTAARMRLLIRFRTTALPRARGQVKPKRDGSSVEAALLQNATKKRLETRVPAWYVDRNSDDRTTRLALGRDSGANQRSRGKVYLDSRTARSSLTVSLWRPLARRRARTARPSAVFMRTRKP